MDLIKRLLGDKVTYIAGTGLALLAASEFLQGNMTQAGAYFLGAMTAFGLRNDLSQK